MSVKKVNEIYEYASDQCLGSSNATVFLGRNKITNKRVAVKRIVYRNMGRPSNEFKLTEREFQLIRPLDHPNVLQYLDYARDESGQVKTHEYIVMENMPNLSLDTFILKNPALYKDQLLLVQHMKQVLEGVQYIHNNNIIHRDLKPENILVSHDYILKIADFGMSKLDVGARSISTQGGSIIYNAPDRLSGTSKQTDLWSIGITFLYMCLSATTSGQEVVRSSFLPDICFHLKSIQENRSVSHINGFNNIPMIYLQLIDKCLSGTSNIEHILSQAPFVSREYAHEYGHEYGHQYYGNQILDDNICSNGGGQHDYSGTKVEIVMDYSHRGGWGGYYQGHQCCRGCKGRPFCPGGCKCKHPKKTNNIVAYYCIGCNKIKN
ncbi:hypothetical protein DFA_11442 [Cavenderia fasciculata]|uniref:Protein kinase domain-containing protein n=1 Tax=Cavenderia fasciculata TaxID=261658 RepID=F4QD00_CACFS|nr:uncharacterized protein DFA_11442 [Cavenderia fasciculata]EGG13681.1 hypothetical protein DFA_11442 [Cavenderia fasciculata]|eukprot:XP_004350385.1 hypothetical protein DFA_11442 [Cavenderia fasciculata]